MYTAVPSQNTSYVSFGAWSFTEKTPELDKIREGDSDTEEKKKKTSVKDPFVMNWS